MNPDKTEIITFGSHHTIKKVTFQSINILDQNIELKNVIRYLGAWLDSLLNFKHHCMIKARSAIFNIMRIRNIRKYLTKDACQVVVCSLVLSHIDYCNGILIGAPKTSITFLQRAQTMASKLILGRKRLDSGTKSLQDLHWLPVLQRIKFKICLQMFKCQNNMAPDYLTNKLKRHEHIRTTRYHSSFTYDIPYVKHKTFAARSFSVQGPKLWNELPYEMKLISDIENFKKQLKTLLFKEPFENTDTYLYY